MENNTIQQDPFNEPPFYKRRAFIYLTVACIALITTGIAAMFHKNYPGVNLKNLAAELINHDVPPGGNRAVLTLASGKIIVLNEAADGKLGEEGGLIFRKTGDGRLRCESNVSYAGSQHSSFHTISTPKGGTYEITLPDGSIVWLNAASTLKFPTDLHMMKERRIELSGEAYFKVVKNEKHPFKVVTDQQSVQVLGTDFNVNNYTDETTAKTTLFEGTIRIRTARSTGTSPAEITLKTGQQAIVDHGSMRAVRADTSEVRAWKNGFFIFDNEPLESIMKKISRWYDVEVIYQHVDTHKIFAGKVSRYEHVSTVLKLLETSGGIRFKIEEGKIIAMKKKRE